MTDRRKRQWVALDIWWPHGRSMTKINEEFGPAGLALYIALITASKREKPQGSFLYVSAEDALWRLGKWTPDDFNFTWDTYITRLGQLKKTVQRRKKGLKETVLTDWEDWQQAPRTGAGRLSNPANSKAFEDQKARLNRAGTAPKPRQETETETEKEKEKQLHQPEDSEPTTPPPRLREILDALIGVAAPPTEDFQAEKQRQLKALKERSDQ